ncbi:1-acylglycerol-3-phosphate O-acyltransferase PNPLA3 isoform X2 [Tachyglossus aculeatus]|uniref:1-acylglycerol-3-phosphate O-acyltransferase PNPLA3 isoform X2 n=1 Tax=Tachyglossus aculeatus TaxID=9261 RepID=UPI0018F5DF2B|nr:1-acylglycerol-3-phosphate O-acyltransferase PNPLA3 isoform X2 [Tachyglossus aculeatus]
MLDRERVWHFSFVGCGFLSFYYIGVLTCLNERAPHLLLGARKFCGSSSGALCCAVHLSQIPLELLCEIFMDLVRSARRRNIGVLHPSFNPYRFLKKKLGQHLPANVHQLVSGKLCVSLTRVPDWKNVLVSQFHSKQDVIDQPPLQGRDRTQPATFLCPPLPQALLCSTFIPIYCGLIPPSFQGEHYVDGGLSNNMPILDVGTTVTVSPFFGETDICPKIQSTNFFYVDITHLNYHLSLGNVYLFTRTLFPPDQKELGELCHRGYLDTFRFLEIAGLLKPPAPDPGLPPLLSSELPAVGLGLKGRPEPSLQEVDNLHALLCQTVMPWDERILGILSPTLSKALNTAIWERSGFWVQMSSLLPVRVLSLVTLPCTLLVESAFMVLQRLIEWIPDIGDDICWLLQLIFGVVRTARRKRPWIPPTSPAARA